MLENEKRVAPEVELLQKRLKRRNLLLDETRKAYLRDVVAVKEALRQADMPMQPTLTSLDLRPTLALYAPAECSYRVVHGGQLDEYGGYVEVVHRESKKVVELRKKVEELMELEQEMRLKATELEIAQRKDELALLDQREQNRDERALLSLEIAGLKERLGRVDEAMLEKAKMDARHLAEALEKAEKRIAALTPAVDELRRTTKINAELELQLRGKEARIREVEAQNSQLKDEAAAELKRYAELEAKFTAERKDKKRLRQKYDEAQREHDDEKGKHEATAKTLGVSRRAEADLKQQLSDAMTDAAEARDADDREQEALREQADELRDKWRLSVAECDELKAKLEQEKSQRVAALNKARKDLEKEFEAKHAEAVTKLKEERHVVATPEEATPQEFKARRVSTVRGGDAALSASAAAKLEQAAAVLEAAASGEVSTATLTRRATTLSSAGTSAAAAAVETKLEFVKSTALKLAMEIDKLRTEKRTLEGHVNKYKHASDQTNEMRERVQAMLARSDGKVSREDLASLLNEVASEAAQLQTELEIAAADRRALEDEADELREALLEEMGTDEAAAAKSAAPKRTPIVVDKTKVSRRISTATTRLGFSDESGAAPAPGDDQSLTEATAPPIRQSRSSIRRKTTTTVEKQNLVVSAVMLLLEAFNEASDLVADPKEEQAENAELEEFSTQHSFLTLGIVDGGGSSDQDQIEALHKLGKLKTAMRVLKYRFTRTLRRARTTLIDKVSSKLTEAVEAATRDAAANNDRATELTLHVARLEGDLKTTKAFVSGAAEATRRRDELDARCTELEAQLEYLNSDHAELREQKAQVDEVLADTERQTDALRQTADALATDLATSRSDTDDLRHRLAHAEDQYQQTVEQERLRLATNRAVDIQVQPPQSEAAVQTTFKTPNMTLRRVNSLARVPHRYYGAAQVATPCLVPGTDDDYDESARDALFYERPPPFLATANLVAKTDLPVFRSKGRPPSSWAYAPGDSKILSCGGAAAAQIATCRQLLPDLACSEL